MSSARRCEVGWWKNSTQCWTTGVTSISAMRVCNSSTHLMWWQKFILSLPLAPPSGGLLLVVCRWHSHTHTSRSRRRSSHTITDHNTHTHTEAIISFLRFAMLSFAIGFLRRGGSHGAAGWTQRRRCLMGVWERFGGCRTLWDGDASVLNDLHVN